MHFLIYYSCTYLYEIRYVIIVCRNMCLVIFQMVYFITLVEIGAKSHSIPCINGIIMLTITPFTDAIGNTKEILQYCPNL